MKQTLHLGQREAFDLLGHVAFRAGSQYAGGERPQGSGVEHVVDSPHGLVRRVREDWSGSGGPRVAQALEQGRQLRGDQATETAVRGEIARAAIVHFATHALAYASYRRARDSFLALASDSVHDGLLTVGELMEDPTLTMRAELVVLSACQTALGSVLQGEGTLGLQRALMARGARSLVVSLWSVDDEATERLMQRFYEHWLGDPDTPSKARALQRAQSDVRQDPRFKHPLYWAGFQLVDAN